MPDLASHGISMDKTALILYLKLVLDIKYKINYSANISIINKQMEYIGVHFISLINYLRLKEK
jgi:hypothetical protein